MTDYEIDKLLSGRYVSHVVETPPKKYQTKSGKTKVKRREITEEDRCPICFDSMDKDDPKNAISWCRSGCGGNFHKICVNEWIASRVGQTPTCPICRSELNILGINPPPPKPVNRNAPPNLNHSEINDLLQRDITPEDYHLLLRLDEPSQIGQTQTFHRAQPVQRRRNEANVHNSPSELANVHSSPSDLGSFEITGTHIGNQIQQHRQVSNYSRINRHEIFDANPVISNRTSNPIDLQINTTHFPIEQRNPPDLITNISRIPRHGIPRFNPSSHGKNSSREITKAHQNSARNQPETFLEVNATNIGGVSSLPLMDQYRQKTVSRQIHPPKIKKPTISQSIPIDPELPSMMITNVNPSFY